MIKFFLASLIVLSTIGTASSSDILINEDNKTKIVSFSELKMIFLGIQTEWDDGEPVTVVVLPQNNKTTSEFLFDYLGMQPSQYFDRVKSKLNRTNTKFILVTTDEKVVKLIEKNIGSIGYINEYLVFNNNGLVRRLIVK